MNTYAVRDCIDWSSYSTIETVNNDSVVSVASLLPNDMDRRDIMKNFVVLAGHILCESILGLHDIPDLETKHILHVHS